MSMQGKQDTGFTQLNKNTFFTEEERLNQRQDV